MDERTSSDWLSAAAPLAGGAGLVSTPSDFLRYAEMLLNEGVYGSSRVMKVETARLATGSCNPRASRTRAKAPAPARARLLMATDHSPGMVGGGGSAGTLVLDRSEASTAPWCSWRR